MAVDNPEHLRRVAMQGASAQGVWNQLDGLLVFGATGQQSDAELLGRFIAQRDVGAEAAFAALVERHGPMVLGVCRRVLGNQHEAEDAFQATFLVLARKAASIARPEELANWLFGVACRTAMEARTTGSRRRARERRVHAMSRRAFKSTEPDESVRDELRAILDEELARLPERYRGALVLCELEGLTRRASAQKLGIPEGTLSSRLARAKDLLRRRLLRRGLVLSSVALDRGLECQIRAQAVTIPFSLLEPTTRAATRVTAGTAIAEAASSSITALTEGALKAMLVAKLMGTVLGVVALAIVIAGAGVLARPAARVAAQSPNRGGPPAAHKALAYKIAVARRPNSNPNKRLVLSGTTVIDPNHLYRIRARFAPARVDRVGKVSDFARDLRSSVIRELEPGDRVTKGDILAVLHSVDVTSKKADLVNALVQLERDEQILGRIDKNRAVVPEVLFLLQKSALQRDRTEINRALNNLKAWDIPQDEIDALYAEAKKLGAENIKTEEDAWFLTPDGRWKRRDDPAKRDQGEARQKPESRWGRVSLRAPGDGTIIQRSIHVGELVLDNSVNLFQIADLSRLNVIAKCAEDDLPTLQALHADGRRWTVQTRVGGQDIEIPGTIDEIGSMIDPNEHMAVIKGHVDNTEQRLYAGQHVTVTIEIPPSDDIVEIPAEALLEDGKQSLVLVQPDAARRAFTLQRVQVIERRHGKVLLRATTIPRERQLTTAEAEQGLLPVEPLPAGERVLLRGAPGSADNRLDTLERKLDQLLEAVHASRQPATAK
jgi:membrane fusion protein, heavy metal efflux system